jgi:UDP-4-amino-4,6-dideoxy-N-acetyl-beta-L-altrosamine transaminase
LSTNSARLIPVGTPVEPASDAQFLPYGRQTVSEEDIEAVVTVLRGDLLTQGPVVPHFEAALADYVGAKHAVAVSSGTAALHLACLAAGLQPGFSAITQPITFAASMNCIDYAGARAELADIDPETLNLSAEAVAEHVAANPDCRAVIPVAYAGLSMLDGDFRTAAQDRVIIEDGCHALGGTRLDGSRVGAGGAASMTCFSFHPVKPLTTGEGGAVTTDDDEYARRLRLLRNHGMERDPENFVGGEHGPWMYEQHALGFNYRMTDIGAALGLSQLARLDDFIARRRAVATLYDAAFAGMEHVRPVQAAPEMRARSAHHLYAVRIDFAALKRTRADVMKAMRAAGVGTQVHYIPLYRHPWRRPSFPRAEARFPASEAYYAQALTLPCFPGMTEGDAARAVAALSDALGLRLPA